MSRLECWLLTSPCANKHTTERGSRQLIQGRKQAKGLIKANVNWTICGRCKGWYGRSAH